MSESAFGVDHGDVSKASTGFPRARWANKAGKAYGKAKGKLTQMGDRAGNASVSVKGIGHKVGYGISGVGVGTAKAGNKMMDHPGKTGAATLGVAGAGAGYGGKKLYDHQSPNGKHKTPRGM